jgi:hypothetical protein
MRLKTHLIVPSARRISTLTAAAGARVALSRAHAFMELVGAATFCWIWLEQACAALAKGRDGSASEFEYRQGLVITARDAFARSVPRADAASKAIASDDLASIEITDEMFG